MISFTFKSHKISIRNSDWRKLKERFDVRNAERYGSCVYKINIECSLCKRYKGWLSCNDCPLEIFQTSQRVGCTALLFSIFPTLRFKTYETEIRWHKWENAYARRQLKAILRRMQKIEEENKGRKK